MEAQAGPETWAATRMQELEVTTRRRVGRAAGDPIVCDKGYGHDTWTRRPRRIMCHKMPLPCAGRPKTP